MEPSPSAVYLPGSSLTHFQSALTSRVEIAWSPSDENQSCFGWEAELAHGILENSRSLLESCLGMDFVRPFARRTCKGENGSTLQDSSVERRSTRRVCTLHTCTPQPTRKTPAASASLRARSEPGRATHAPSGPCFSTRLGALAMSASARGPARLRLVGCSVSHTSDTCATFHGRYGNVHATSQELGASKSNSSAIPNLYTVHPLPTAVFLARATPVP